MAENQKGRRPGLKDKLKNAVENISVDVFGYEKKVSKNVMQYLTKASREEHVPLGQLFARILIKGNTVRVYLHHQGKLLKEIPVKELVYFFAGQGAADLLGIESKVVESVKTYINELSKQHEVYDDQLQIRIATDEKKVIVGAYNHMAFIKEIPVKELVKYFK